VETLLPNIYQFVTKIKIVGPFRATASMHLIKSGDDVVLIDPFNLPESETAALESIGKPTVILIAGIFHDRDAEAYRKRYGAKILAHREATPKLSMTLDETFGDGETLPGGLTAIEMTGTIQGETIFWHDQGTLIAGDALLNIQPGERSFFQRMVGSPENLSPMTKLFIKDKKRAAASYQKLLEHDFDQILVSHGKPVLNDAKAELQAAVEKAIAQWRVS
jgi:glyoxylase-like metal-dependent hydrolase (beta-lactamase superfamily II)